MRWLTNNLGLKLLALMFAATLSAYVYYEINYPVPDVLYLSLDPAGLDPELVLASELPRNVAVGVRGSYRSIRLARGRDLSATLDLSLLKQPGTVRLHVQVPQFGDLTVTQVDPSDVVVEVDHAKSQRFTVQVEHRGSLDKRYQVSDEQWSPKTVRVTGPNKVIERIATARVEPELSKLNTEIDAFKRGTTARLKVNLYDDNHQPVVSPALKVEPADIEYSLSVKASDAIKVLKVVPDYTGYPPSGQYLLSSITASPQYISVAASRVKTSVTTIRTEQIDLEGRTQSFVANPKLVYPFEVPAGSDLPEKVEVTVEILSLAEEGLSAMSVEIARKGEDPQYEYVVTPPQLKVISNRLSVLSAEDRQLVSASVDAAGLGPGDYRLMPQLRLPQGLDDARINPGWVTLTVIEKGR